MFMGHDILAAVIKMEELVFARCSILTESDYGFGWN